MEQQRKQHALEEEMREAGVSRYRTSLQKARDKHRESQTSAGQTLMRRVLNPRPGQQLEGEVSLVDRIEQFIADCFDGKPTRRPIAAKYINLCRDKKGGLKSDVLAFITAKHILDSVTLRESLTKTARGLATMIEDECRFAHMEQEYPDLFKRMRRRDEGKALELARKNLIHMEQEVGGTWETWPLSDKLHIGQKMIEMFILSTGMVEVVSVQRSKKDRRIFLQATEATMAWIKQKHEVMEVLQPVLMPTIVEPKDWTTPYDGGYHSNAVPRLRLLKTRNNNYLEELENTDMPEVYDAVNLMQRTRWSINREILTVIEHVWANTSGLGCLPTTEALPLPAKPLDIDTNEDARKIYRRAAAKVHEANRVRASKALQVGKVISVATRFKDEPVLFFPACLDFRGRAYAVPPYLNPQGPDFAKACLQFAEGKPLGDQGACWLAIHGANCAGQDKVPLQQRIEWVEDNSERIIACAKDPYGDLWWTEADEPWQFLAFCFEWAGYAEEGVGFVSHLAVALDGSCNGLQHFSAILRDEVGGRAVNLLPTETPADIYQTVADAVKVKLEAMTSHLTETFHPLSDEETLASQWLASGILNRKVAKRPTMTLVYGATKYGMKAQVHEVVREAAEKGPLPFEGDGWAASAFLADHIWDCLGEVVTAARLCMDWLQDAARLAAAERLPVNWTTPVGLPVQQAYKSTRESRVDTMLLGKVIKLSISEEGAELDKRRQASGIAPNWVHSMDAAHLQRTVNLAAENGVTNFALVHDSYGTHAADAEMLGVCLRKAFQQVHEVDVLAEFRDQLAAQLSPKNLAKLPPLPAKGTLDLSLVEQADYFFA